MKRRTVLFGGVAWLPFRSMAQGMQMQPIIDLQWRFAADTVMGGVSSGQVTREEGVLRLSGEVSTENNGGFIQMRTDLSDGLPPGVNAIHLRVRGNGEPYYVFLRSVHSQRPWQSYRAQFASSGDWADITLRLADFAPSRDNLPATIAGSDVRSLGIVAYGRDFAADLSVSHLGFGTV